MANPDHTISYTCDGNGILSADHPSESVNQGQTIEFTTDSTTDPGGVNLWSFSSELFSDGATSFNITSSSPVTKTIASNAPVNTFTYDFGSDDCTGDNDQGTIIVDP